MKISGKETNKARLIDFINALLPEEHKIVELNFQNYEYPGPNSLSYKAVYDQVFKQAFIQLERAYSGQANLGKYETRLRDLRDLKSMVDTAFEEGKRVGEIQIETVKMMKAEGEPIEKIIRYTGL